jgi:hypothetical protein
MIEGLQAAVSAWSRLWEKGKELSQKNTKKTKKQKKNSTRRGKKETIQHYYQRTMKGRNLEKDDVEAFGDKMHSKGDETFRVGFQNIANLPQDMRTAKSRQTISYMVQRHYDVFMMSEIGLCWKKLGVEDQWFERTFGKFKTTRSCMAYNKTELGMTRALQPGGVGILAADDVVHRIVKHGRDESGLGRWAWLKLQGRQGTRIRIISVYRPCDSDGPESVNQQQQRFLTKKKRLEDPREAIYADLFDEVSAWIEEGDQIIIGIDANEDVRTGRTAEFFRALGMKEAILSRHQERSPPATYNRNNSREPIDGLWVTPGLKAVAAGY